MKLIALGLIASTVAGAFGVSALMQGQFKTQKTMNFNVGTRPGHVGRGTPLTPAPGHELAIFGAGCFWGVEDTFRAIPGVTATAVGYTGGTVTEPTYQLVCTHTTGHVETVLVEFDPKKISYRHLVDKFWDAHDPTQINRQGPDYGDNYRSAIFTFSDEQQKTAIASRDAYQKTIRGKIATTITPAEPFWIAEDYHQQYHAKTGTAACPIEHAPKIKGGF